jgi:hypothetical protein
MNEYLDRKQGGGTGRGVGGDVIEHDALGYTATTDFFVDCSDYFAFGV